MGKAVRKMIYRWWVFNIYVSLPEGNIYIYIYNIYIYIYNIYIYTIYIYIQYIYIYIQYIYIQYIYVCVTTYPFVDIYSTIRTDEGSEAAYCLCTMYSVFTPICSKRSKYRLIHQTDQSPTVDFAFYTYPLALWQSNIACWSLHLVRRFPSYKHPFSSRISQLATFDYWRVIFITLWLWLTVCHGKIHHF